MYHIVVFMSKHKGMDRFLMDFRANPTLCLFELIQNGRGIRPEDAVATDSAQAGGMTGANSCPARSNAGKDEEGALTVSPPPLPVI